MGLPKTLALTLGGLVALGAVIYIFRNNLTSGAKSVGSAIGESVGGLFGSIPAGIVSGGVSGLTGGVDQKTLEETGNSTGKLGLDFDTAFKNLNDNLQGLFHLGDKEYFQTIHADGAGMIQNSPYSTQQPILSYESNAYGLKQITKQSNGILKSQVKPITILTSELKQGGKYQLSSYTDRPQTYFKRFNEVTYKYGKKVNLPLSQQAEEYYKKIGVGLKSY